MNHTPETFRQAMRELRERGGPQAEAAAFAAFEAIARWASQDGHGNCHLSCINRRIGKKLKLESYLELRY